MLHLPKAEKETFFGLPNMTLAEVTVLFKPHKCRLMTLETLSLCMYACMHSCMNILMYECILVFWFLVKQLFLSWAACPHGVGIPLQVPFEQQLLVLSHKSCTFCLGLLSGFIFFEKASYSMLLITLFHFYILFSLFSNQNPSDTNQSHYFRNFFVTNVNLTTTSSVGFTDVDKMHSVADSTPWFCAGACAYLTQTFGIVFDSSIIGWLSWG